MYMYMYKGLRKCHSVCLYILFSRRFTSPIAVTHAFHAAFTHTPHAPG